MSTSTAALAAPAPEAGAPVEPQYSRALLAGGLLGRAWLWFVAGCLIITLLPIFIGWRPYAIQSGSMEPRIAVGDVVIAAPEADPAALIGRVAVFTDPDHPDRNKAHRVLRIDAAGALVTKGDANPTEDSAHVATGQVQGLGRLLVRFVALPLVWAQNGQWLWLLLFLASVLAAAVTVSRDREDDEATEGETGPPDSELVPFQTRSPGPVGPHVIAAASSPPAGLGRTWVRGPGRWVFRLGYVAVMAAAVCLPPASAAFAAKTTSPANSWSVPNFSYTTAVNALGPYLYWKLDETTGDTVADSSGNGRTGTYSTNGGTTYFARGLTGALPTDTPNNAVTLKDTSSCINTASATGISAPSTVTVVAWIKAAAGTNGKVVGFEKPRTGVAAPSAGTYDRMIYIDGAGSAWFAVYNDAYYAISSGSVVADGSWHMLAASLGPAGMRLYVDGAQVASNANNGGETTTGWWRVGCGNLGGWGTYWNGINSPGTDSATPANRPFIKGSVDEVSVFTSQLTPSQISFLYFTR